MTRAGAAEKAVATEPLERATAPTSVVEARKRVEELAFQEVERYRRLAPKRAELFAAQQSQDFPKAAVLREEVEYLDDVETGRQNRRASILHLHRLQAQDLEEGAAALEAEVVDRQAKAKLMFSRLEDLEGDVEMRTRYYTDRTKTQQLEVDATAMKQKARALRRDLKSNSVQEHGSAYGVNVDELIDGLMQLPETIGPTIASVYEWVNNRKGQGKFGQRMVMRWYASRISELEWQGIIRAAPMEIARK